MLLLFISGFWVLFVLLVPYIVSLFVIIALVIVRICCLKSKAKVGVCLGIAPKTPWAGVAQGRAHPRGAQREQ